MRRTYEKLPRWLYIFIIAAVALVIWGTMAHAQVTSTRIAIGHGYTANSHTDANPVYLTARNLETASSTVTTLLRVGQSISPGAAVHVYRTFLATPINLSMHSVTACTLFVNGDTDASTDNFVIKVVAADAYKSTLTTADTKNFTGWAASGTYSITALANDWNSSTYSAGWNAIVFNAEGLTKVFAAMNDTLWIALLSNEDVIASEPTTNEYVAFDSPSDALKPYLSISYTTGSVTVKAPNDGETLKARTVSSITWSPVGSALDSSRVYYGRSGGAWNLLATVKADSMYAWTVPDSTGSNWLVKVVAASDLTVSDVSNAVFSIIAAASTTTNINSWGDDPSTWGDLPSWGKAW